ncbi:MAG: hypothetical protein AB1861_06825 [Cyanobacteriota bacterium]
MKLSPTYIEVSPKCQQSLSPRRINFPIFRFEELKQPSTEATFYRFGYILLDSHTLALKGISTATGANLRVYNISDASSRTESSKNILNPTLPSIPGVHRHPLGAKGYFRVVSVQLGTLIREVLSNISILSFLQNGSH